MDLTMPVLPGPHAVFAIALTLAAIFMYTRERIPLEVSSLVVLIIMLVWFESSDIELNGVRVRARDLLAGFGNEALVAITALMVLARSLEVTRALQPIGHVLAEMWKRSPQFAFLLTMLTVAGLSMFLNNTPVVAAMLPLLVAVTLQAKVSTSGILMPIGFATIIGGMATTIGTSTNLLVISVAADLGMREMTMFEFAGPVFVVGGIAIAYLWLIAPHLLPTRRPPLMDVAPRIFETRLRINEDSVAESKTLPEALALTKGRMRIEELRRDGLAVVKLPSVRLKAGDQLYVRDTPENLKEYEQALGATLLVRESGMPVSSDHPLESHQRLAEVAITEGSALELDSLDSSLLLSAYGVLPIALHRPGRTVAQNRDEVGKTELRAGDVLLVQASERGLEQLRRRGKLLVLDGQIDLPRRAKASLALAIMGAVIVVAAFGLMRISAAAVCGIGLMLATRCLTWSDLREAVDRRIILVVAASLALGVALTATGAVEYIAHLYVALLGGFPAPIVLSGLILIMALLTEVATNNAIAVLGTPIAIGVAHQIGAPPEPFALAVLYGANMSYMTPFGYQTNLLVMSAGGYTFSDFLRVGVPLQIIMWLGMSIVLPMFYRL